MKAIIILLAYLINILPNIPIFDGEPLKVRSFNFYNHQVIDTVQVEKFRIRPFHLEIVPPSSGIQFYREGIIFMAQSKIEEKVPQRHLSFGSSKVYTALIADTMPGNCTPFNIVVPELFPAEAITFSSDFNTMYLSLIPEKTNSEKIFKAEYTPSGWKIDDNPLEICPGNYIYSHPCLSSDDGFMIFSSDMPGTTGGLDLFITKREGSKWSNPENIGTFINSAGNELFASLDNRNNLYFSSDGHPGKGGYDIYLCRFNGSGWDKPHNLTEIINTKNDELAFTINKIDEKTAFYVSRTRSGRSKTQIYILDWNPSLSTKEYSGLGECFLAIVGMNEAPPTEKSKADQEIASSSSIQQIRELQAEKKTDGEQPNVTYRIAADNIDPATSMKTTQSIHNNEFKKELTSDIKQPPAAKEVSNDAIIYRVQILANTKPAGSQNIVVAGNNYKSFEYLYKGGYRTTIGEFRTLAEATRLQSICRQSGYTQAFVVAFKNNVRSTDPQLFK